MPHGSEQGFLLWHSCRDSLYLWFPLAEYAVLFTVQDKAMAETPPGFGWVGSGWDGLFCVTMTEYSDYEKNKAVGLFHLIFCVWTDKLFGEDLNFPFSSLCTGNSDPVKHWFVWVMKTLNSCENTGHKAPTAPPGHQPEEQNVGLRACPSTVTERYFCRDLLFTDGSTEAIVAASHVPVLWVLNYSVYVGKELEEDCSNRHVVTLTLVLSYDMYGCWIYNPPRGTH